MGRNESISEGSGWNNTLLPHLSQSPGGQIFKVGVEKLGCRWWLQTGQSPCIDLPPLLFHTWTASASLDRCCKAIAERQEQGRVRPSCGQTDMKKRGWGWLSIPAFFFQTHESYGPLPPISSGSRYSVLRKTRKISPHGAKRCGTECSLLLMLSQPRSSIHLTSCLTALFVQLSQESLESQPPLPQLDSHLHAPPYNDMDHCPPYTLETPLNFRVIMHHKQNALYYNSFLQIFALPSCSKQNLAVSY